MWEKIGASSGIIIGAIVLFLLFALVLFIFEKDEIKKRRRRKTLCAVPKAECGQITQRRYKQHPNTIQNTAHHDKNLRKIS